MWNNGRQWHELITTKNVYEIVQEENEEKRIPVTGIEDNKLIGD